MYFFYYLPNNCVCVHPRSQTPAREKSSGSGIIIIIIYFFALTPVMSIYNKIKNISFVLIIKTTTIVMFIIIVIITTCI